MKPESIGELPDISHMKTHQLVQVLKYYDPTFFPTRKLIYAVAKNIDSVEETSKKIFLEWLDENIEILQNHVTTGMLGLTIKVIFGLLPKNYLGKYIFIKNQELRNVVIENISRSEEET